MTIDELKSLLSRFRVRPNRKLGQNFLLDEHVLDEMLAAGEVESGDTVLEIGPGLGVLTRKLGERAGLVLAVEKDRKLVKVLRKIFKSKKNIKIIHGDALNIISDKRLATGDKDDPNRFSLIANRYKVVANIPYNITGKLLQSFLTVEQKPKLMVLLVQEEVAERIVAKPGELSVLALSVQFYGIPEIIAEVPKQSFFPVPEVDSAVVKIAFRERPLFELNEKKFFQLIKVGFSSKRKMLVNNLVSLPSSVIASGAKQSQGDRRGLRPRDDIKEILNKLGINPKARAQELSLHQWYKLYEKTIKN